MKKRTSKEIFSEALLELSRTTPVDKITVKQIVEAHHGTISVADNPGGGTVFTISLPVEDTDDPRGGTRA